MSARIEFGLLAVGYLLFMTVAQRIDQGCPVWQSAAMFVAACVLAWRTVAISGRGVA